MCYKQIIMSEKAYWYIGDTYWYDTYWYQKDAP